MSSNNFLASTGEKLILNQYWYSNPTIAEIVTEIEKHSKKCAFLSTPSIFFSLKDEKLKQNSTLFDFDDQWSSLPNYVKYDFRDLSTIPSSHFNQYDFIVIDPPFITQEVWDLYAQASKILLVPTPGVNQSTDQTSDSSTNQPINQSHIGGRILLTTIPESAPFLQEMLNVKPVSFRPSIPNLIYQYSMYTNYQSINLSMFNTEIDPELAQKHNPAIQQAIEQSNNQSIAVVDPIIEKIADQFTARKACSYEGFGSDSMQN